MLVFIRLQFGIIRVCLFFVSLVCARGVDVRDLPLYLLYKRIITVL